MAGLVFMPHLIHPTYCVRLRAAWILVRSNVCLKSLSGIASPWASF
jgi:hypothetical protein